MSFKSIGSYHQGWVYCKQNDSYAHMYAQLHPGKYLVFYQDEMKTVGSGNNWLSRVDLRHLVDVNLQCDRRQRIEHPIYVIILKFQNGDPDVKLRMSTVEDRGVWARYIRAVGLGKLPDTSEHLLPGQIQQLEDIIRREKNAPQIEDHDEYEKMSEIPTFPWLYENVKHRREAEEILSNATTEGSMLIRKRMSDNPGDDWDYAISAMSRVDRKCTFHHYRMKWSSRYNSYEICLTDGPHPPLRTLEDVVAFFERRSSNKYRRLTARIPSPSHLYEQTVPMNGADSFAGNGIYVNDPCNVRKST